MRRLFLLYGAALTSAVLIALLVPLAILARDLAHDRAMAAARQQAQGLTVLVAHPATSQLAEALQAVNHGETRTTVFLAGGQTIGAPSARTPRVRLAARGLAFTAATQGGQELLVPVAGGNGVAVIRTYVPDAVLFAGVGNVWAALAGVGVFLLVASSLVGAAMARRLAVSVTSLATTASRIAAGELDAKVSPMGPSEVVSVGRVLNDLGTRVESMLKEERELGADLSHRLRTPVTALRLDVESLSDPAERTLMSGHVEALAAAVDEAVSLAREGRAEGPRECDVDRVVRLRGAFWSILAREAGRPFTLVTPGYPMPTRIPANRLGAAIDALLDNVFQHTPDGTELSLRLIDEGERFRLVVADDGPGMVAGHSERGTSGAGSTGIGMDVARRAARDADGELVVRSSSGGGTSVELRLTPSRNLNRPMQHT